MDIRDNQNFFLLMFSGENVSCKFRVLLRRTSKVTGVFACCLWACQVFLDTWPIKCLK